jgi:protein-S-isoprenylcysteine O-methyltransferase Ste14/uncharacterized membrane protein (UPF0127 family)
MPLLNATQGIPCPYRVYLANSIYARMIGLLGTDGSDPAMALWFVPCSSIHTFGMNYPIDALYLDEEERVVRILEHVKPNQVFMPVSAVKSVLELPAGAAGQCGFRVNDRLEVVPDDRYQPDPKRLGSLMHWPLNALIAVLWGRFVLAALNQCLVESHPLTFGIVIHNTLLMFFFLMRRKSLMVSSKALDWAIPFLTLCGALLLRAGDSDPQVRTMVSVWLQCSGLAGIIFSLLSLGKSFGIVPANRKIVCAGAYRIVRHPLYLSEIVFYSGFVSANPSAKNVILILMILAGQLYRSVSEETLLAVDPSYRSYRDKVRFRFIPGLF